MDKSLYTRGKVVTFHDDDKVLILERIEYEGNDYVYINQLLQDETPTSQFDAMVINADGSFEYVADPITLVSVLSVFQVKLAEYLNSNS